MLSTQLACPHCGSTLTFGMEVVAGTSVDCLICMQTFAAANPISLAAPTPPAPKPPQRSRSIDSADSPTLSDANTSTIPKATPAAKAQTASWEAKVAKPKAAPVVGAITEKSVPKAAPAPPKAEMPAPSIRKPRESAMAGNVALIAVTAGLLLLLTGGIAIGIWKITASTRIGSDNPEVLQTADNSIPINANGKNPDNGGGAPLGGDDDEDDIRAKLHEEFKHVLKRKTPSTGGNDLDWDAVSALNVPKQTAVGLNQQKINAAIEKGVVYLKKTQQPNGTWTANHAVGNASIGGLTLLECGTPRNDMVVQRAAAYVRSRCGTESSTYEISLAILFLDRLGDPRDRGIIQGLALRLYAGQNESGGWTYNCAVHTPQEMYHLYNFLQANKQPNFFNGVAKTPGGITMNPVRVPSKTDDPFPQLDEMLLNGVVAKNPNANPKLDPKTPNNKPLVFRPEMLPPSVRDLPAIQFVGKTKKMVRVRHGNGDNSNTQFAILALWAARRHGVPTDQALLASYQRFASSQNGDSGWGYTPNVVSTNTMTCVGLLGLALGHGAAPVVIGVNPKNPKDFIIKPALEDEAIQKGLQALARSIRQPSLDPKKTDFPMENLYFLWSVERVAMLYDLKTIAGKDWYGWGAQILVHNQRPAGEWINSNYHGANPSLNTCFALLFLRRSNLVQDLTNNLRLQSGVRDHEN